MKLVLISLFFLSMNSFGIALKKREKKPQSLSNVKRIFYKLKKKKFKNDFRDFVSCCRPNRMVGTTGHGKATSYIINKIKEVDNSGENVLVVDEFNPDFESAISLFMGDFEREVEGKILKESDTYKKLNSLTRSYVKNIESMRGQKGKNIIWEKKGYLQPEETIVIGAHYDTLVIDKEKMILSDGRQPGADNNASGVSVLLSLIEVLTEVDLPKTLRIVFFDYGEWGFLGSKAYVKKYGEAHLKNKKFAGYVDLIMLGHDTKSQDKEKRNGNMKVYTRKESSASYGQDLKLLNLLTRTGRKLQTGTKFWPLANGFQSSGHVEFWKAGLPAIVFTQDRENDYNKRLHHSSNDLIETINFKTLYSSFQYIGGSIVAWAFDLL